MKLYRVANWSILYENNKSRERAVCSYVCVPNKQDGLGLTRILAEKDGAAIYGVWCLILGMVSRQKSTEKQPRDGWLTEGGHQAGTALAPSDLALRWRRPAKEIERAMEFLSSPKIGWIEVTEITTSESTYEESARQVPVKCPLDAPEEKRREEKGSLSIKSADADVEGVYAVYPRKVGKGAALKEIRKALGKISATELIPIVQEFARCMAGKEARFVPHPSTWFHQERWQDDPRNWREGSTIKLAAGVAALQAPKPAAWTYDLESIRSDLDYMERYPEKVGEKGAAAFKAKVTALPPEAWAAADAKLRGQMEEYRS